MQASHNRALLPTQPLFAVGQRFGSFVVEAVAGEGGMGAVYKARDTKLGRLVALKVIRPDADQGPAADTIARFLREAKVGAALSHPGIAVVYEAGAIGDNPFLAMEWVEGTTLGKLVEQRTLPVARLLEILEAIAEALAYAHSQGVIHRDVKPSNVMVDARGRVRLVDFGIAKPTKLLGAPGTQMLPTHARAVLGTPAYMAPEQMLSPAVDHRADQFSWGVLAYEILANAHPIQTVPDDGPSFPVARPKPLAWLRPDLSEAVAAIVHRAMSFEAGARFPSMDDLLVALRAARLAATGAPAGTSYPPMGAGATTPSYGPPGTHPSYPSGIPRDPSSSPTVGSTYSGSQVPSTINTGGATAATPPPHHTPSYGPPQSPSYGHSPSFGPSHGPSFGPTHGPSQPAYASGQHAMAAAPKKFPLLAVMLLVGGGVLFLGGGGLLAFFLMANPASNPAKGSSPLPALPLGGSKTAYLESFDDLEFGSTPPVEIGRAKVALEQKISACFDGSVSKEMEFRAEVDVAADGRIVKIIEQNVCKEDRPSFFLCTERGKTPKRGFPTVPDSVFACIDRTLLATRLPKVSNVDSDTKVCNADFTFQVR